MTFGGVETRRGRRPRPTDSPSPLSSAAAGDGGNKAPRNDPAPPPAQALPSDRRDRDEPARPGPGSEPSGQGAPAAVGDRRADGGGLSSPSCISARLPSSSIRLNRRTIPRCGRRRTRQRQSAHVRCVCACVRCVCVCARARAHVNICMRTCVRACVRACVSARSCTHVPVGTRKSIRRSLVKEGGGDRGRRLLQRAQLGGVLGSVCACVCPRV